MEPIWKATKSLKGHLKNEFGDKVSFFTSVGNFVIVHSSMVNPYLYTASTLKGVGLRDMDYVKSFSKFIKRKAAIWKESNDMNVTSENLMETMDEEPIPELYNVIYSTLYPYMSLNEHGLACTESSNIGRKIWSLSMDWTSLICKKWSRKQHITGLVMHRITGKKEPVQYLHRLGLSVSYNRVLAINNAWAMSQPKTHYQFANVRSLHSTTDNIGLKQETRDGGV